jgi:hypothetical protein
MGTKGIKHCHHKVMNLRLEGKKKKGVSKLEILIYPNLLLIRLTKLITLKPNTTNINTKIKASIKENLSRDFSNEV